MRDCWDSEYWNSLSSSEKILVFLLFLAVTVLFFVIAFFLGCTALHIVGVF